MYFKIILTTFFLSLSSLVFSQSFSVKSINDLTIDYNITEIVQVEKIEKDGQEQVAILANIRTKNGKINGLILLLDKNGKLLKTQDFGAIEHFDRIIGMAELEDNYTILTKRLNEKTNKKEAILYHVQKTDFPSLDFKNELSISNISNIPNLVDVSAICAIEESTILLAVSVRDNQENFYPILVGYNPKTTQTKILQTFEKNNRFVPPNSKPINLDDKMPIAVKDKNGKMVLKKVTKREAQAKGFSIEEPVYPLSKECNSIQFIEKENAILLIGQESSTNFTDFWIAKCLIDKDFEIVWEDEYQTEIGGDEGRKIYKTEQGYLAFGLNYQKRSDYMYSYRTLSLDKNGKEINGQNFNQNNKSWYKDVTQISDNQYLIYGQNQKITRAKSWKEETVIHTSDLWFVLVNDKGEKISDYKHETTSMDIANKLVQLSDNSIIGIYQSDDTFKMITFEIK